MTNIISKLILTVVTLSIISITSTNKVNIV